MEDLHWVDAASEEVLAKFAETLTATQSMFVGSFRPEYHGPLREMSETTIMLAGYAKICSTQYRDLAEELDARGHLAIAKQFLAASAGG